MYIFSVYAFVHVHINCRKGKGEKFLPPFPAIMTCMRNAYIEEKIQSIQLRCLIHVSIQDSHVGGIRSAAIHYYTHHDLWFEYGNSLASVPGLPRCESLIVRGQKH